MGLDHEFSSRIAQSLLADGFESLWIDALSRTDLVESVKNVLEGIDRLSWKPDNGNQVLVVPRSGSRRPENGPNRRRDWRACRLAGASTKSQSDRPRPSPRQ
jgi:hypothetical protein